MVGLKGSQRVGFFQGTHNNWGWFKGKPKAFSEGTQILGIGLGENQR